MTITANDLQNLIITTLGDADPTALAGLRANVPSYWQLWNRQGVLPELQYWYTRREAIRYLQACVTQQTDFMRRSQAASRNMAASSRQDASMSASASEVATSLANRSSSSTYSDSTTSTGTGSSSMNRNSSQSMSAHATLSDTGSGSNAAAQNSALSSSSTVNASFSDATAANRYSIREVCGFHERLNRSWKGSEGVDIGIGQNVTATATYETETGTITQTSDGAGNTSYVSKQQDFRANTLTQSSAQSSSSHFNANRTTTDTMSASGSSRFSSNASSSFSMNGSGSGSMTGTGTGGSAMTASSIRTMAATGEAHRVSNAASNMTSSMERLHQRFLQLRDLWKRANAMIEVFEKQRLNLPAYLMEQLIVQYPAGINADTANLYLVKTPFGDGMNGAGLFHVPN